MAVIYIDNRPYEVADGQNLLQAVLSLGLDLPYFCWHPALGSVGACRQCAVKQFKDEEDERGRIVMACMTPAEDGTRISIDDPDAADFRAAVLEWLMTSHPHDCPICDEGGECHLQDMTVMTGHVYRRHRFKKRTFRNQDLGPFINHEMNRCITCYRCVRFYQDYAGGRDLVPLGSRNRTYFGRSHEGPLESPFSGNLIEICPTGVFTDKTLKAHYARKWDLQTAPTVCIHCGLGCNTITGERYGTVRRTLNRYNGEVNGHFLCDRGRFGYAFLHDPRLLRAARLSGETVQTRRLEPAGGAALPHAPESGPREVELGDRAIRRVGELLQDAAGVVGIGSPRASLESNFALRALVGEAGFSGGLALAEAACLAAAIEILREGSVRPFSLAECGRADAVLILGEDVTQTAPMLDLAVRQAIRRQPIRERVEPTNLPLWDDACTRLLEGTARGPLHILTPAATALDRVATRTHRAAPADIARLGMAVAHELDSRAPAVSGLTREQTAHAREIAAALAQAQRPVVVAGASSACPAVICAAGNVARALAHHRPESGIVLTAPECNTLGAALIGPRSIQEVQLALEEGHADTLVVLENDLHRRLGPAAADRLLASAKTVIAIDLLETGVCRRADVVLPAASYAEAAGTYLNDEGRLQRSFPPGLSPAGVRSSWRWISEAAQRSGRAAGWSQLEEVGASLAETLRVFAPIARVAPSSDFRLSGRAVPRQPHRFSGRTAMQAHKAVSEPKPPEDSDTPLGFTMEGSLRQPPPELIPRIWAPAWNSVQALIKFQEEVGGPLRGGDAGVRLFERREGQAPVYAEAVPEPFRRLPDQWRQVALGHIFGSEELSALAPAIAQRAPKAYVALNRGGLEELGIAEGDAVELPSGDRLPVRVHEELPDGTVGVPFGLLGLPMAPCDNWISLRAAARAEAQTP